MIKYNPQKVEKKWQQYWLDNQTFVASDNSQKDKKYVLVEFPYPSGEGMHMGHVRPYTAADVTARYYRMTGKEVLFPMGWDAFGLPAENYAIKHGKAPVETTAQNIANIKKQFLSIGYSFDWSREVNTTDPGFYKWTQWLFLQFYKAGLAYEATGLINWCPKDKTGLANEEVVNGQCERCGTVVEKKELRQWYLKITEYAEKLLQGLDQLSDWPEAVKLQQQNWIGKSEGAEIEFEIKGIKQKVKVFTTRPDTIFGATYLVLAPEHELVKQLEYENKTEVEAYIAEAAKQEEQERLREDREKTGVQLKGIKAINSANGEEIPIWVADYVLGNYGTGAIMAVPAHDERDFEFAKKFNLPIVQVIVPEFISSIDPPKESAPTVERQAIACILRNPETGEYGCLQWSNGWKTLITGGIEEVEDVIEAAKREIAEETGYQNLKLVKQLPFQANANFFHRNKNENRYAYFTCLVFDLEDTNRIEVDSSEKSIHEFVWVTKDQAEEYVKPGSLNYFWNQWLSEEALTGEGKMINSGEFDGMQSEEVLSKMAAKYGQPKTQYKLRDWVFSRQRYWGEPIPIIHCDPPAGGCGIVPVSEDQLPVLLPEVKNYEPTGTGESPLAAIDEWVNTQCPKCDGPAKRETNTMPQWAGSSWYYLRYIDAQNKSEFASQDKLKQWLPVDIYFGGMEHTTLHLLYSRFWNIFLYDQGLLPVSEPYTKRVPHGIILAGDGTKMSKSKGNVVNPDEIVKKYGADTTRMYELFLGPHGAMVAWNDTGIIGVSKFLDRVWRWVQTAKFAEQSSETAEQLLHGLIKKTGEDIESYSYNTCISSFMKFYNDVKDQAVSKDLIKDFLVLLHPFAPHVTEELFEFLGGTESLQHQPWPKVDSSKLISDTVTIAIQVNGKLRDTIEASTGLAESEITKLALVSEKVQAFVKNSPLKKVIYVQDKILNIVV